MSCDSEDRDIDDIEYIPEFPDEYEYVIHCTVQKLIRCCVMHLNLSAGEWRCTEPALTIHLSGINMI